MIARLAPMAAVVAVAVAIAGRFAGWALPATLVSAGVLVVAVIAVSIVYARRRESDDAIATRVDDDANLGGELRSAHWFASKDDRDDWTDFHLQRAAARASGVEWAGLYPAEHNIKSWAATAACLAIAVTVSMIGRTQPVIAGGPAAVADGQKGEAGDQLSDELRAKLDALLAAMGKDQFDAAANKADLELLKKLMANVDPALQKKLDDLLKQKPATDQKTQAKGLDENLDERGADTTAGLPEDVKWALEDLAAKLANSNAQRQTNENNPGASTQTGEKGKGSAQAEMAAGKSGDPSIQMVREAASDPGAAKMMPGGGGMMGGDSRAGQGGNNPNAKPGSATPEQIAQTLRKELIEAQVDAQGENVSKEDLRRKTEKGTSAIGFTRVAAPANFDPSRATAPPTVPEARQPLVQQYFIRR
jgi:hypothetical protein